MKKLLSLVLLMGLSCSIQAGIKNVECLWVDDCPIMYQEEVDGKCLPRFVGRDTGQLFYVDHENKYIIEKSSLNSVTFYKVSLDLITLDPATKKLHFADNIFESSKVWVYDSKASTKSRDEIIKLIKPKNDKPLPKTTMFSSMMKHKKRLFALASAGVLVSIGAVVYFMPQIKEKCGKKKQAVQG